MGLLFDLLIGTIIAFLIWKCRERKKGVSVYYPDDEDDSFDDSIFIEENRLCARSLKAAYLSLKSQGGAGYGCWISSCLERLQNGRYVSPKVALRALYMTRDELAGRRFNLDGLNKAIEALETKMGEWE